MCFLSDLELSTGDSARLFFFFKCVDFKPNRTERVQGKHQIVFQNDAFPTRTLWAHAKNGCESKETRNKIMNSCGCSRLPAQELIMEATPKRSGPSVVKRPRKKKRSTGLEFLSYLATTKQAPMLHLVTALSKISIREKKKKQHSSPARRSPTGEILNEGL